MTIVIDKASNVKISTLLLGVLIYKFILDLNYIYYIHPQYGYAGFGLEFDIWKYCLSLLWIIIIILSLPRNTKRPSTFILLIHFVVMIIPMSTFYAFNDDSSLYFAMVSVCFIIECIIVRGSPTIKIPSLKNASTILFTIISVITVLVYSSMIAANGLPSLAALNLENVYDIRAEVVYPSNLMNYLVPWQAKVINPCMIAYSFKKGNKKLFFLFIGLQFILFLMTAHKSYLFIPIAIVLVIYFIQKGQYVKKLLGATIIFCTTTFVLAYFEFFTNLASLFIRRFLFVPAQLKFYYYDFASTYGFLYFSQGQIGDLFGMQYPYSVSFPYIIGSAYFGKSDMAANTGYLATGYTNLGFLGILIYSLVIAIILIYCDSIGKKLGNALVCGMIVFSMLSLNDADLLTNLLTGGMFLLMVMLWLFYSVENSSTNYEAAHFSKK